jgi:aspartate-semialdehyde dehydrogenase
MTQTFDIAVIGATGTVGETLVQILEERDFPVGNLHCWPAANPPGSVPFRGKNVRVREVDEFDFSKVKVFFAAGPAVTLSFARAPRRPVAR